jgi:hypothetical protein
MQTDILGGFQQTKAEAVLTCLHASLFCHCSFEIPKPKNFCSILEFLS